MFKKILITLCLCMGALSLLSQNTVSGKVTDSYGKPLRGATVVIKGATTGATSDVDGRYSIKVPNADAVLVFSFIGFKQQEIVVGGRSVINVSLSGSTRHELSIYGIGSYGMGGYFPLNYNLGVNGSVNGGIGGGGLGYTFNITSSIGIVMGVEMSIYNSEASFDSVEDRYSTGTGYFSYSLSNYMETQNIILFSVPIMVQYGLPLGRSSTKFYVSGGFKLGLPISAKAEITPGTATTSGYFTHEDVNYYGIPQHGFVSDVTLSGASKDIDLGFSATLALETGIRFSLSDKIGLYTGVYFDYGLNNIQKVNDKHLLEYDFVNEYEYVFQHNSVLNSDFMDKVDLLSIGLKVRIAFGL